jgi:hypothetical protein
MMEGNNKQSILFQVFTENKFYSKRGMPPNRVTYIGKNFLKAPRK